MLDSAVLQKMFPDDSALRGSNALLRSPSPELDSDCLSSRETPEGTPRIDVPLVKYVKWGVPQGDPGLDSDGQMRRAVPREILPDSETARLRKSLSSKKRRHRRKPSFEIGCAVENGALATSDSELDDRSKWASARCSPFSVESSSEKPDIETMSTLSELYRESYVFSDDASDIESTRLSFENQSMRRSKEVPQRRHVGSKISDIAEAVQKRSARSSTDYTALKILGSRGLNSRTGMYDNPKTVGERGFTVSPLPSASQLRAAKAAQHSYDSDSETDDSVSFMDSGYSDMIGGCANPTTDCWARVAAENPYSTCDELQPRFKWLRRSVGPFTALAGAFLVIYGPRILRARQRRN